MKHLLPILSLILLLTNCITPSPKQTPAPWTKLSWLNKTDQNIVIKNKQDKKAILTVSYFNKSTREVFDKKIELEGGESETVSFKLFRPEIIKVSYLEKGNFFYAIPTKNVEIDLAETLNFVGANQQMYTSLASYGDHDMREAEFSELLSNNTLPEWLADYLVRSRALKTNYKIYSSAGYQQFSGVPNVQVPAMDSLKSDLLLSNSKEGLYHNYYTLLQIFKSNFEFMKANKDLPKELENYSKRKNLFENISKIEDQNVRNDLLAIHIEGSLLRKRKSFNSKEKILNYGISLLPENYVLQLNEIEAEYTDKNYDTQKVIALLEQNIENIIGENRPPLATEKGYKLLKFWFAGCAPCKKEIPYDKALLHQFKNLELLQFCYSTAPEVWKSYVQKHDAKGSHFFLNEESYKTYKKVFSLGYAPRYILLSPSNEVLCWECSNPSNKELEAMLGE